MTASQIVDRFSGQNKPKINLHVSVHKPSYLYEFFMRNSNLQSKIVRNPPFNHKMTICHDTSEYQTKARSDISGRVSMELPVNQNQFFTRSSNLQSKVTMQSWFNGKVTFWPHLTEMSGQILAQLSNCQIHCPTRSVVFRVQGNAHESCSPGSYQTAVKTTNIIHYICCHLQMSDKT